MKRAASLMTVIAVTGCGVELVVPEDATINCAADTDCVDGYVCSPSGRCVTELSASALALRNATAIDATTVVLTFDQEVLPSLARELVHYAIAPALEIHDAFASNATIVTLKTAEQGLGIGYTVTVSGLVAVGGAVIDPEANSIGFTGFGAADDTSPPDPVAPPNASLITELTTTLTWTTRSGAASYTILVARDAACAVPVVTQEIAAPSSSITISVPGPSLWHWCVKANTTTGGSFGHATFNAADDAIYVFCPTGIDCGPHASEIGSPNAPLRSIQRAIALARARQLHRVRIAGRGGVAAYDELVQIVGYGVDLEGGYSPSFAVHDPFLYRTRLHYDAIGVLVAEVPAAVSIANLAITVDDAHETVGLLARNVAGGLTLRDTMIDSAAQHTSIGVIVDSGADTVLEGVTIDAKAAQRTLGVRAPRSAIAMSGSVVRSGSASTTTSTAVEAGGMLTIAGSTLMAAGSLTGSTGVAADGGFSIVGNVIAVGPSGVSMVVGGSAVGIALSKTATGTFANNRMFVVATSGPNPATGISLASVEPVTIRDNVIVATGNLGSGITVHLAPPLFGCDEIHPMSITGNTVYGTHRGLHLMNGGHPIVTNNIFSTHTNPLVGHCVHEEYPTSTYGNGVDPLSFQNNLLLGCDIPYWEARWNGSAWQVVAHETGAEVDGQNGLACNDGTAHVRYSGNVVGAQASSQVFDDEDGADDVLFDTTDDDIYEVVDNDYSLLLATDPMGVKTSGKDATTSDCGSLEAPQHCGGTGFDLTGAARGAPFSIGAFED